MSRQSASLIVFLISSIFSPGTISAQAGPAPQKQERDRSVEAGSMTGCVDEQEGGYVLIDARSLAPLAKLEAVGFPNEGFAKHLGNTVTVKGTVDSKGPRPVMKVRSVETVSNGCGLKK